MNSNPQGDNQDLQQLQMNDIESIVLEDTHTYDVPGFGIAEYQQQSDAQLGWTDDLEPPEASQANAVQPVKVAQIQSEEEEDDESQQISAGNRLARHRTEAMQVDAEHEVDDGDGDDNVSEEQKQEQ